MHNNNEIIVSYEVDDIFDAMEEFFKFITKNANTAYNKLHEISKDQIMSMAFTRFEEQIEKLGELDVNAISEVTGYTPLGLAAIRGSRVFRAEWESEHCSDEVCNIRKIGGKMMVEFLFNKGASPEIADVNAVKPPEYAVGEHCSDLRNLLEDWEPNAAHPYPKKIPFDQHFPHMLGALGRVEEEVSEVPNNTPVSSSDMPEKMSELEFRKKFDDVAPRAAQKSWVDSVYDAARAARNFCCIS
jgi:hypothetical protein